MSQLNCCKASTAPDRAANQERTAQHFDSVMSMPAVLAIAAISQVRSAVIVRGHAPPDHLVSLALLCSRQI